MQFREKKGVINTQHVKMPKGPYVNGGDEVTVTLSSEGVIVFPWPKGEGMPGEFKARIEHERKKSHEGIVWRVLECVREDHKNAFELWNCEDRWFMRNYC